MTNPFQQPSELWLLAFATHYKNIPLFEDFFAEKTLAISSHEITSETVDAMPDDEWRLELYFDAHKDAKIIPENLLPLISTDSIQIIKVENKDWTDFAASSLGEIKTAKFHIIRSNITSAQELIPIILDLTRAFGTGEHATTMGCLEALELYADNKIDSVLDIGTGTGILAIAAKKLWPEASVTATDIDEVAIDVAGHHADINNAALTLEVMDGVASMGQAQKYDIILANILARPLIEMGGDITSLMHDKSILILSGFLENQMQSIVECYGKYNIAEVKHTNKNNWITLILTKI